MPKRVSAYQRARDAKKRVQRQPSSAVAHSPAPEAGLGAQASGHVEDVHLRDDSIRLGQFLKLAGLVDQGSDAKALLAEGVISVNGEPETRRGRALTHGDVVEIEVDGQHAAARVVTEKQ